MNDKRRTSTENTINRKLDALRKVIEELLLPEGVFGDEKHCELSSMLINTWIEEDD